MPQVPQTCGAKRSVACRPARASRIAFRTGWLGFLFWGGPLKEDPRGARHFLTTDKVVVHCRPGYLVYGVATKLQPPGEIIVTGLPRPFKLGTFPVLCSKKAGSPLPP